MGKAELRHPDGFEHRSLRRAFRAATSCRETNESAACPSLCDGHAALCSSS